MLATELQVRHSFTRVAGVKIHWAEAGAETAATATPVVLIHGLQDCHLTWRSVISSLARHRRVLMPDLPGHGLSERPDAAYDLAWYARITSAWLETINVPEVDVVGHSLGGGIAQMLLLECRDRIRRLVLAASGGLGREITSLLRLASIPLAVEYFGQPFLGIGTRLALRGVLAPEDLAALSAMNTRVGSARAFARTVRDLIDWRGQRRRFSQRAHEVGALPPIAVIWGERDRVIPAKHAEALAELVDGVQVTVLKECGHYLQHEQPELFSRVVRQFLDAPVVSAARLRGDTGAAGRHAPIQGDSGSPLGTASGDGLVNTCRARPLSWPRRFCKGCSSFRAQ
jgi:pimeloyl-ACP methyl ester carboxylesterase